MDDARAEGSTEHSFTWKALAFGLVGACLVVVAATLGIHVSPGSPLIGNHLPPAPFFVLLVLVLGWNPLFGRIRALRFAPRELVVVFGLVLICAWIPYSSLLRYLQRGIVMPQIQVDTRPEWRKNDTLGHLPSGLFPLGGSAEASALAGANAHERQAALAGTVDAELATIAASRTDYLAALDLAQLVPPRLWTDDPVLARRGAEAAWQRLHATDQARWAAVGALLTAMPDSLVSGTASGPPPPVWALARGRLTAGMEERLPAARREYDLVYTGMMQGMTKGDEVLPLSAVPFIPWLPTIVYWGPLVITFAMAVLMLSLVVHRQWSRHEQLTYPIAAVAMAVVQRSPGHRISDIFSSRLFWFGAIPVTLAHLLNYLSVWFPGQVPQVTVWWLNYDAVSKIAPGVNQAGVNDPLGWGALYFAVIGLSYFIASEVSFSLGISGFAVVAVGLTWYAQTGTTSDLSSARSGAYLGYAGILLFTGRHYYWNVAVRAFGAGGGADPEHSEPVWAARLFLASFAGFVVVLVGAFQLDWLVALVYALTVMIFFLVMARVVSETGLPFITAGWHPVQILVNVLGFSAVGPGPIVLMWYLGSILTLDPRECLMPYASTAFRLAENAGVSRLRLAATGSAVMMVALVVGTIACTWGLYHFSSTRDSWSQTITATYLDQATTSISTLSATGQYEASANASGFAKIPLISDNTNHARELGWTAFGLLALVTVAVIRFRFPGCPIHPVLFLLWGTYALRCFWFSFLLGWLIKSMVVRFGGGKVYQDLKPLFIGLIVAELVCASLVIMTGWAYYLATGQAPRSMNIFPG